MTTCRICEAAVLELLDDLGTAAFYAHGSQTAATAKQAARHSFRLGGCPRCGVIELLHLPDVEALRPAGAATLFRDPERHLTDLARITASLLESTNSFIVGMTYKDVPFLNELRLLGFNCQQLLDRERDWELTDPRAGIETIQREWTVERADRLRERHGPADLLVVRHVLEHTHHPREFLAACRRMTEPHGLTLFEVPGCETEFLRGDLGALWEEHVHYFSSLSLFSGLSAHGFEPLVSGSYPYTIEDCLAIVGRFGPGSSAPTARWPLAVPSRLVSCLSEQSRRVAAELRAHGKPFAVFGAGHRTSTWIELSQLTDLVACVIDDDPSKQGQFLPGSGIPVRSSEALLEDRIEDCLVLIARDVLRKIAKREDRFVQSGGRFLTLDDLGRGA